jgi:hypothetical protein
MIEFSPHPRATEPREKRQTLLIVKRKVLQDCDLARRPPFAAATARVRARLATAFL